MSYRGQNHDFNIEICLVLMTMSYGIMVLSYRRWNGKIPFCPYWMLVSYERPCECHVICVLKLCRGQLQLKETSHCLGGFEPFSEL
jgi:hypothetical protein